MKKIHILTFALFSLLTMSSCGVYKNYQPADDAVNEQLYGEIALPADSSNMANLSWQELFTDIRLQQLIQRGLTNNTDINIAKLRIDQAEATLRSSKLAFLPSLALSPQGGAFKFGNDATQYTYSLPIAASWQIDVFGKLRNAKQRSKVLLQNSYAYQRAVQIELVAGIASQYYTLAMLREQAEIIDHSIHLWTETIRAMQLLMSAGQDNEAAVSQAEANYNRVLSSQVEVMQQIREVENSLSVLLGEAIHTIDTQTMDSWRTPSMVEVGLPIQLLTMRPDVMMAEYNLAAAFYTTNEARADFYPSLTLSGNIGWTNLAGVVTNPGKLLWEAMASLTQPIFQNGRLKAQYKIAQSQQEEAKLNFRQTLLDAGVEVNNAYSQVQTNQQKSVFTHKQVDALERTVRATRLLMDEGSSNYLEVLTAQNDLLSAQLELLTTRYNEINSYISLYQALGGGFN